MVNLFIAEWSKKYAFVRLLIFLDFESVSQTQFHLKITASCQNFVHFVMQFLSSQKALDLR